MTRCGIVTQKLGLADLKKLEKKDSRGSKFFTKYPQPSAGSWVSFGNSSTFKPKIGSNSDEDVIYVPDQIMSQHQMIQTILQTSYWTICCSNCPAN